jgi:hypothetical protein
VIQVDPRALLPASLALQSRGDLLQFIRPSLAMEVKPKPDAANDALASAAPAGRLDVLALDRCVEEVVDRIDPPASGAVHASEPLAAIPSPHQGDYPLDPLLVLGLPQRSDPGIARRDWVEVPNAKADQTAVCGFSIHVRTKTEHRWSGQGYPSRALAVVQAAGLAVRRRSARIRQTGDTSGP